MPVIHAIVRGTEKKAMLALDLHGRDLCRILAEVSGYNVADICLIPRILTQREEMYSHNFPLIHLDIDLGIRPDHIGDETAELIVNKLSQKCPGFSEIHFTVWLKQHKHNGSAEHRHG